MVLKLSCRNDTQYSAISNSPYLTGLPAASSIERKQRLGLFGHAAKLTDDVPAKLKMVSGHHPTGSVLEVDLPLSGFIRSTGTPEYR